MSRSVAGLTIILYVCVVSGEQYPSIRLKGTPTDPSIAIGVISGGNYPAGSFSIGYGGDNENGDAEPGVGHGVNSGKGQIYPNTKQGQTEGGSVNGQNDISSYGGQNDQNGANNYGVPFQNPRHKPTNPNDDNYYKPNINTPLKNSASRMSIFSQFFNFDFGWFY